MNHDLYRKILGCLLLGFFHTVNANLSEIYECQVLQVTKIDKQGIQKPENGFASTYLLGARFMVNRQTGVITGRDISTEGYVHKILADGRTLRNPLTILSTYAGRKEDGVNASVFLVIETYKPSELMPFFLKGMNLHLMSGTCRY